MARQTLIVPQEKRITYYALCEQVDIPTANDWLDGKLTDSDLVGLLLELSAPSTSKGGEE